MKIWWCEEHLTGSGNHFEAEPFICPVFAFLDGETTPCRMVQMRLVSDDVLVPHLPWYPHAD